MAGKHRAKKRPAEAYVWLGTGAMTLGLGVALAAGSGVAQADTTNASVGGSGVTPSPDMTDVYSVLDSVESAKKELRQHLRHALSPDYKGEDNPVNTYLPGVEVKLPK